MTGDPIDSDETAVSEPPLSTAPSEQPWIIPTEYERGGAKWLRDALHDLECAHHPLLAQVPRREIVDMPRNPPNGEPLPAEASGLYRPATTRYEWTVNVQDVVEFNVDQLLADIDKMADDVGGQMVKTLLEHISAVSEQVGNVVSGEGRDFYDVFAESLEKIEMTFDEDGKHDLMIVLNPKTLDSLITTGPSMEQQGRIDDIINRKREAWLATRRRRDLP